MTRSTLLPVLLLFISLPIIFPAKAPALNSRSLFETYPDALEAIFGIGLRSSALLADPSVDGNVIISPISITLLLGQLMLGAEGKVLENLASLLSLKESKFNRVLNTSTKQRFRLPYANFQVQMKDLLDDVTKSGRIGNFTLRQSSAVFYDSNIQLKERFR